MLLEGAKILLEVQTSEYAVQQRYRRQTDERRMAHAIRQT